jgi:hypothetical protein
MGTEKCYDVVISFAGEDRKYAKALADALTRRNVAVFYDEYEKAALWGVNLYTHLSDVYQNQAQYCVMLLSEHYARKVWTNHEREAAQARAFQEHRDYILPVRLDDTEIPGILPTIGYLRWPPEDSESIADAILIKLGKASAAAKSVLSDHILAIEAKDGTVWFGEEKYRNNGRFTIECNFYVLVGIDPVTLLSITSLYYAYGCPSLSLAPHLIDAQTPSEKLIIDHTEVSLALDGELRPQCELPANRRSTISYFCSFRPPLRCTQPADCDNGDIMVSISWRTASQLKTQVTNVIFRFTDTGIRQMEKADSLRQPPRVTDAELQAWYTEGKLTEQALEDLRKIDPWKRYMDAFNDITTSWRGSETGFHYTSLLRELVGNSHKPEL